MFKIENQKKIFNLNFSKLALNLLVGNFSGRPKFDVQFDGSEPNWHILPVMNCLLLAYEFPNSLDAVWRSSYASGAPLRQKMKLKARIQIAEKPFAKGVERVAYYGRDLTNITRPAVDIVLKKYIGSKGFFKASVHYETSIQLQTIAAYMASKFTIELMEKVIC